MSNDLIPVEIIENKIFVIREHKVMLDSDLAGLYDIETKALNRAVKRNSERFPDDFMFQLKDDEWDFLRCQFGTSKEGSGGRRYNPYVFTEQGVAMLSSVLNSKRAIAVNVQIMRIFVKIRQLALTHTELAVRLNELEQVFINYTKENTLEQKEQNENINEIFKCIQYLVDIHKPGKIGFKAD